MPTLPKRLQEICDESELSLLIKRRLNEALSLRIILLFVMCNKHKKRIGDIIKTILSTEEARRCDVRSISLSVYAEPQHKL